MNKLRFKFYGRWVMDKCPREIQWSADLIWHFLYPSLQILMLFARGMIESIGLPSISIRIV